MFFGTLKYFPVWILSIFLLFLSGCATFKPEPFDSVPSQSEVQTINDADLVVRCSILSDEEAQSVLDMNLGARFMQAIWLEVANHSDRPYWLLSAAIDPNYFSPDEVAYSSRFIMSETKNEEMVRYFRRLSFKNPILPGHIVRGLIFVNKDADVKQVNVELFARDRLKTFDFFFSVPGPNVQTLFDVEHGPHAQSLYISDEQELQNYFRDLSCCTTNAKGDVDGDPLNLVLIGNAEDLFPAFVRSGWHLAEETYIGSVWKTIQSFLFGQRYRYSPVSPLYFYGRKQDIALQKARGTIHQRNHLRLWLTPLKFQDKHVWVGQVSRDIGVRFTTKAPFWVTHKIDPDIDEARNALTEDMLFSQGLVQVGYVRGFAPILADFPKPNLTGDPFFTNGLRVVLMLDHRPTPVREVRFFGWDNPGMLE